MDSFLDSPYLTQSLHFLLHGIPQETTCHNNDHTAIAATSKNPVLWAGTKPYHAVAAVDNGCGDDGGGTGAATTTGTTEHCHLNTQATMTLEESNNIRFLIRRGGKQLYTAKLRTAHQRRLQGRRRLPLQPRQDGAPLPPTDSNDMTYNDDIDTSFVNAKLMVDSLSSSSYQENTTATESDALEVYRLLAPQQDDQEQHNLLSDEDTVSCGTDRSVGNTTNVAGLVIMAADEDTVGAFRTTNVQTTTTTTTALFRNHDVPTAVGRPKTTTRRRSPKSHPSRSSFQRKKSLLCKMRGCRKVAWCTTNVLCEAHYPETIRMPHGGTGSGGGASLPTKRKRCAFPSCQRYGFIDDGKKFCRYHDNV